MTLPMARELGRAGIRVITLAPGVLIYFQNHLKIGF